MAKKSTKADKRPIEQYEHKDKDRLNNPPVGLVTSRECPSPLFAHRYNPTSCVSSQSSRGVMEHAFKLSVSHAADSPLDGGVRVFFEYCDLGVNQATAGRAVARLVPRA